MNPLNRPVRTLAQDLESGAVRARDLVESALAAIADESGEGSRAFVKVLADQARAEADASDRVRLAGGWVPPFGGIPIAIKDLADTKGDVTTAGSVALAKTEPAFDDAVAVARLRSAGFVVIGRTNMTEFAFSGLGLNPHYGTPASPWDRAGHRIPGGSSSGSAVAVADGMSSVGLGTDTGGSCRIPAAFCNIVGFKPTARRVPLDGVVPLAPSLDSVGPLANSVDCVGIADAVMAGGSAGDELLPGESGALRLGVIANFMLDDLDDEVADRFGQALGALSAAGVSIAEIDFPELDELGHINRKGGLAPAEALQWHEPLIAEHGAVYDQRVRRRIEGGATATATYYIEVLDHRRRLVEKLGERCRSFDALVAPTVAILPPPLDRFPADGDPSDPDDRYYSSTNFKALRNTSVGNFLDACAISLPLCTVDERPDAPAVGLMLMAPAMGDESMLRTAATLEPICAAVNGGSN